MSKEEWGVKRLCPTTGKRFYDLGRTPIVSPYTGEEVTVDANKNSTMVADKADPATAKADGDQVETDEDIVLDDDDVDVDLGDDVLEDDDDDDNVSLDEIADVAAEGDDDT
ncbi:TIGR02300 family protein [Nereida sp. MMG025]|uniref:TIGR02300 family protein n=1 Tax=Nereida sp. MMG025 TaxID=2909981 RepID=UPI001F246304|nr:TIGR02300 family protein [Nereida sp. MMG025]MCF6445483.1 TIGR02300 family protein [Nereida sp. MMG025]